MGSTRERIGSNGSVRYTALYRDLKGRQRSAGTFTTQRQADRAWQRAEARVAQGQLGEPGRGRQTFRDYVEQTWLPNHEIDATTRQSYTYILRRHILPHLTPAIIVYSTLGVATSILIEASLSYLGIGVPLPQASWGQMVSEGQQYFQTAPWLLIAPGVALIITVLAFNLAGDWLTDLLDPATAETRR